MIVATVILLIELTALFFTVSFLVQLSQRKAGPERLREWLGGRPVTVALKGIAIGFVTPFCTYSAIPLLVGFRQAGVPPAGYVAFIVAAPVLDPILLGALVLIVGVKAAVLYVSVAFAAALGLGLLAERVGIERQLKPLPAPLAVRPQLVGADVPPAEKAAIGADPTDEAAIGADPTDETATGSRFAACGSTVASAPWRGLRLEAPVAARGAFALLTSLAPLLLVGVGIGVAITALVTPEMTADVTGAAGPLAIPVSAAFGTPLYFNTELYVPIADALRAAGVGTGPIVALTIAGAGANLPEFVILGRLARRRLLVAFVSYVFAVAVLGGVLTGAVAG